MLINKELYQRYFKKDRAENFVNMDINIFKVLKEASDKGLIKNAPHKAFTLSYLWLVSYLWKYSKYGDMEISTKDIKEILGVSAIEKRMDYLIKKNGVLDSVGLLETTRNFPIHTDFSGDSGIKITQLSDLDDGIAKEYLKRYNSRYTCKKPLTQYGREGKVGMLFSKDDTLPISVLEFTRIVLCGDLGVDGFIVYSFLKLKSKMVGYLPVRVFFSEIEKMTGFKERKIGTIIKNLETIGVIKVSRDKEKVVSNGKTTFSQNNEYSLVYKGK